jgi:hypothetical protein
MSLPESVCPECGNLEGHRVDIKTYAVVIKCPKGLTFYTVRRAQIEAWSKSRHHLHPKSEEKERIWRYYLRRLHEESAPLFAESKKWINQRIYEGYFASYKEMTEAVNDLVRQIASAEEINQVAWIET